MDILTPRGQVTVKQEERAARIFEDAFPGYRYVGTDKAEPVDYDALIYKDGRAIALVETKCRGDMTFDKLMGERRGEWLITADKVERCIGHAKRMFIPFYGFLYLPLDDLLITLKIWHGKYQVKHREQKTETRANVNGGKAVRRNMFISVYGGRLIHGLNRVFDN